MNEKILEEYSVKIYDIDPYFYEHCKKKVKVDKNEHEYLLLRNDVYFTEYFQPQKLMNKTMKAKNLFFLKKEALEKKLGGKFIRINTSNAKKGCDTDYEVSKIETFISKFKENKIKELEEEIKKLKPQ